MLDCFGWPFRHGYIAFEWFFLRERERCDFRCYYAYLAVRYDGPLGCPLMGVLLPCGTLGLMLNLSIGRPTATFNCSNRLIKYARLPISLTGRESSLPFQKFFTALIRGVRARANKSRASSKGDGSSGVPYICIANSSTAATSGGAESSRSSSRAFGGG